MDLKPKCFVYSLFIKINCLVCNSIHTSLCCIIEVKSEIFNVRMSVAKENIRRYVVKWEQLRCKIVIPLGLDVNRIGGVIVSLLASSAVDRGFKARSGRTKEYDIGMCCFFPKHVALTRKRKEWLFFYTKFSAVLHRLYIQLVLLC